MSAASPRGQKNSPKRRKTPPKNPIKIPKFISGGLGNCRAPQGGSRGASHPKIHMRWEMRRQQGAAVPTAQPALAGLDPAPGLSLCSSRGFQGDRERPPATVALRKPSGLRVSLGGFVPSLQPPAQAPHNSPPRGVGGSGWEPWGSAAAPTAEATRGMGERWLEGENPQPGGASPFPNPGRWRDQERDPLPGEPSSALAMGDHRALPPTSLRGKEPGKSGTSSPLTLAPQGRSHGLPGSRGPTRATHAPTPRLPPDSPRCKPRARPALNGSRPFTKNPVREQEQASNQPFQKKAKKTQISPPPADGPGGSSPLRSSPAQP